MHSVMSLTCIQSVFGTWRILLPKILFGLLVDPVVFNVRYFFHVLAVASMGQGVFPKNC